MLLAKQRWIDDLARLSDLYEAGFLPQTARRRIKRGVWQEPLSGVVCRTTGTLTPSQWLLAASLYGGAGAAISHGSAGASWGFARAPDLVHVTVPHGRNIRSTERVRVHQSRREFLPVLVEEVWLTPPARTALDMSLSLTRLDDVQALLGRALQSGRVTTESLGDELDIAPRRGSRLPRTAMADLVAGSRAASEARLRALVLRAGLPAPELNAAVATRLGTRYVDALWRSLRKGVEIDGQAFHIDPRSWQRDLERQNAIQATGIVLLRIAARRLWTEPDAVIAEIAAFLGVRVG
jgi:very-short-patch-repair endonuclease